MNTKDTLIKIKILYNIKIFIEQYLFHSFPPDLRRLWSRSACFDDDSDALWKRSCSTLELLLGEENSASIFSASLRSCQIIKAKLLEKKKQTKMNILTLKNPTGLSYVHVHVLHVQAHLHILI